MSWLGIPNLVATDPNTDPAAGVFPVQHHVVIYRTNDDELRILRILHARRDIDSELDR